MRRCLSLELFGSGASFRASCSSVVEIVITFSKMGESYKLLSICLYLYIKIKEKNRSDISVNRVILVQVLQPCCAGQGGPGSAHSCLHPAALLSSHLKSQLRRRIAEGCFCTSLNESE